MDRNKPVPPPTGPTVCPFREEGPTAGPGPSQPRPAVCPCHPSAGPPTGPTVCPFREEGPTAGPADTRPPVQHPEPEEYDVDARGEPECEVHECEIPPGGPRPVPVAGRPVPTEAQRAAPKPANYAENVSKLQVMGFDRERAENALMAGDFDLKRAIALLQGR